MGVDEGKVSSPEGKTKNVSETVEAELERGSKGSLTTRLEAEINLIEQIRKPDGRQDTSINSRSKESLQTPFMEGNRRGKRPKQMQQDLKDGDGAVTMCTNEGLKKTRETSKAVQALLEHRKRKQG